jgi:hypothetical protein
MEYMHNFRHLNFNLKCCYIGSLNLLLYVITLILYIIPFYSRHFVFILLMIHIINMEL